MSSKLAQNTFSLTIAMIGQKIIAFVYFLFLARVMMPEQTGLYFLAVSIAMICSVVSDFGITPVVVREIAKTPQNTKSIIRHLLAIKIPLLLLGYVSSLFLSYQLGYQKEVTDLVFITGLVLVLDSVHLFFYGVLRGQHRLSLESFGMFFGQLVTAFIGGMVLWLFPSIHLLAFALLGGSLLNIFLSAKNLTRQFGLSLFIPIWNWHFVKPFLHAALPFALAAIFVKVYSYVDTVLISKFLDTTAVGLYSIAYKFTYAFQFLPLAFIAALYPRFSALMRENSEKRRSFVSQAPVDHTQRSMTYVSCGSTGDGRFKNEHRPSRLRDSKPSSWLLSSLLPRSTKSHHFSEFSQGNTTELTRLFDRSLWYMLILATPIVFGLSLMADQAVLLAGQEYRDSARVLSILVFVLIPIFLDFPIGSLLNASGRQMTKTTIMGVIMILNILLNVFLIPLYGIVGSAYAALVSFTVMFLLGLFFIPKIIHGYRFRTLIQRLVQSGVCGILLFVSGWLMRPFMHWMLVIPLCAVVYFSALFLTGLVRRDDFTAFKSLLRHRV